MVTKRKMHRANQTQQEEVEEKTPRYVVYAPSGMCPIKLPSTKKKDIQVWMTQISEYGLERGLVYTPGAYLYYAQYFFPRFTKEHKKLEKFIKKCYIVLGLDELIDIQEKNTG